MSAFTPTPEAMLEALRRIAAQPLWGEPIADRAQRLELIALGEYDATADVFEPSSGSECDALEAVVTLARRTLRSADDASPLVQREVRHG